MQCRAEALKFHYHRVHQRKCHTMKFNHQVGKKITATMLIDNDFTI